MDKQTHFRKIKESIPFLIKSFFIGWNHKLCSKFIELWKSVKQIAINDEGVKALSNQVIKENKTDS